MAPSPKVQRNETKAVATKSKSKAIATKTNKSSFANGIKKPVPLQKMENRQRTKTAPDVATPNGKKPVPAPTTSSVKKPVWKRQPKPAHSGVPVPEKMRKLLQKRLQDLNDSL